MKDMTEAGVITKANNRHWGWVLALVLGVASAAGSWTASSGKSATFDEPVHAVAAVAAANGDYRYNSEHPVLWKRLAGMAAGNEMHDRWRQLPGEIKVAAGQNTAVQWPVAVELLYRSGMDGEGQIRAMRGVMSLGVVLLVLGTFFLAREMKLGAGWALFAAGVVAMEPSVLGHGALLTNDVLTAALAVWCVWGMMKAWQAQSTRRRLGTSAGLGLLLGAALAIKFSAVALVLPAVAVVMMSREKQSRPIVKKLLAAGVRGVVLLLSVWLMIWSSYGFSVRPGPDAGATVSMQSARDRVAATRLQAMGQQPSAPAVAGLKDDLPTRAILATEQAGVLPQAYLHGLLNSYSLTRYNNGYLLGEVRGTGWWYYFPVAMAVKAPLGWLVLMGLGVVGLVLYRISTAGVLRVGWPVWLTAGVFVLMAMVTPMNIGYRHMLPVVPLMTVLATGVLSAMCVSVSGNFAIWFKRGLGVLLLAIATEVALVCPNWIAFQNVLGRSVGVLAVLSDSNLDWGQDLTELARWRKQHPQGVLYLAYFGTADPKAAYGIEYINVHGGYDFGPKPVWPRGEMGPGYLAVSTTVLQGVYANDELRSFYAKIKGQKPAAVLGGGTIWIYQWE